MDRIHQGHQGITEMLLSFAFMISNFVSAASSRPHPVQGIILKCRRRSKSTGTRSQYASLFGVHRSRRVARRCNPIGHGTGSTPGSWIVGSLINYLFWTYQRFDSATVCARGVGWSLPHPGGYTISDVSISVVGESQYR